MALCTILVNASYAPSLLDFRGPLLRRMASEGHRVHASAPGLTADVADKIRALGAVPHNVHLQRTGQNPLADLAYCREIFTLIRALSVDLVMGYTIKPCIWGSLAARLAGVDSVSLVTGLGYAFIDRGGARQRAMRALTVRLWGAATSANRVVIFQNPDDRDDFIEAGALAQPDKARLVDGSGVDMNHFQRMPLPAGGRFLMIARLLGNKGVREYAEAAAILLREGVDASFKLAGYFDEGPDGISESELAEWCAAGLQYLGPLEDVRPALADCSVFVLPSYREGLPRTVLEAMATGRAIITSDAPGCRHAVVDGESGWLVPTRAIPPLVAAMRMLAGAEAKRAAMGDAAYDRCRRIYAVERVNDAMLTHLGFRTSA